MSAVAVALADARDAMLAALLAAERDDFDGMAEGIERATAILERVVVEAKEARA